MVMTREEFIALLTPRQISFFSSAIRGGLAVYANPNNYSPEALRDHSKSVRAQVRNAHIVSEARRLIAAEPDLGIQERKIHLRTLFQVSSQAFVSFKRLDEALRGHNYQTYQAKQFNRQLWPADAQTIKSGGNGAGDVLLRPSLWTRSVLPDMINVWAGYRPDSTETRFDYYIVCPDGEANAWEWQLSEADIAELTAASRPGETEAAKKIRRRVIPRKDATKKQATDGSLE